ncbi:hypothetical protein CYLTODRAFT_419203 [Cylindrobasidium torrendii FP15055 ss-10]|uniref:Uncharacterized protein n=1 Tax=Cylindrobasidium torrendii FP15055 ss-10 TaxID=1314674 RepID=A0A0D7BKI4_9AGAR|nr:hypothetical protein CYLTODRAFT_419203 [Cylindrobasidium torrendii FP15055 ss-10]
MNVNKTLEALGEAHRALDIAERYAQQKQEEMNEIQRELRNTKAERDAAMQNCAAALRQRSDVRGELDAVVKLRDEALRQVQVEKMKTRRVQKEKAALAEERDIVQRDLDAMVADSQDVGRAERHALKAERDALAENLRKAAHHSARLTQMLEETRLKNHRLGLGMQRFSLTLNAEWNAFVDQITEQEYMVNGEIPSPVGFVESHSQTRADDGQLSISGIKNPRPSEQDQVAVKDSENVTNPEVEAMDVVRTDAEQSEDMKVDQKPHEKMEEAVKDEDKQMSEYDEESTSQAASDGNKKPEWIVVKDMLSPPNGLVMQMPKNEQPEGDERLQVELTFPDANTARLDLRGSTRKSRTRSPVF